MKKFGKHIIIVFVFAASLLLLTGCIPVPDDTVSGGYVIYKMDIKILGPGDSDTFLAEVIDNFSSDAVDVGDVISVLADDDSTRELFHDYEENDFFRVSFLWYNEPLSCISVEKVTSIN